MNISPVWNYKPMGSSRTRWRPLLVRVMGASGSIYSTADHFALENVWSLDEAGENGFREEVRTTFLHEIGHCLGLNEDELMERGLE